MVNVPDRVVSYTANADFWTRIIREGLDPYRIGLTNAAVLDAAGDVDGLTVLDGGCAEGYMARELAGRGAKVAGIDSCEPLIAAAQKRAEQEYLSIDFTTGDLGKMPYGDDTFDLAVLNHVVNDLEDSEPVFAELGRVVKPGGRLVIMMLHPCFYSSARAERETLVGHPMPAEYFATRTVQQPFEVAGIVSPAPVKIWLRPLEVHMSMLLGAGFVVTGMSEPHPSPQQLAEDRWWTDNFTRPLFLLITAERSR